MAYATAEGAHTGMPLSVAREFIAHDKPGKLPEHVKHSVGGGLGRVGLQGGGFASLGAENPWWERQEARSLYYDQPLRGGLIGSSGAGRTDTIPASVAADSHVIPAAEISGLGQGNSLAGARILSAALRIGPYGTELPQRVRGPGARMPSDEPPRVSPRDLGMQQGGRPEDDHPDETSVLVAGGEYLIPKDDWIARDEHGQLHLHAGVQTLGNGDVEQGHKVLNNMIMTVRDDDIKTRSKLPPPKS